MSDAVLLWQRSTAPRGVRCTMAQIGEEVFELRLWRGRALVGCDTFPSEDELLRPAEALKAADATSSIARAPRGPGDRPGAPSPSSGRRTRGGRA